MQKQWTKIAELNYAFTIDGAEIGALNTADGTATIGNEKYRISWRGFWKNRLEITDSVGAIIATAEPEKWYANTLVLKYNDHTYRLVIHNNPLAEWAILDGDKTVLAYGLTTNKGKAAVNIKSQPGQTDYLLDFLLWYLFWPIAAENTGDTLLFILMAAA